MELSSQVKAIAREKGAALVGIASRERLAEAPPSANPDYLLPATRSIISFAIPLDRKIIRDYLSKRDWLSHGADHKRLYRNLYEIAERLVDFLKEKGFEAVRPDMNNVYRPEGGSSQTTDLANMVDMVPDFSHRYGAVAAGLGRLGWSGNLMTPQFGSVVFLGSVLTSAVLEPDPLLEEDPCDKCKLCTTVCPVEMMAKKETMSVTIAGREYSYGKKETNARCIIACGHNHGLGPDKTWSTWSPYHADYPFPDDVAEVVTLSRQIRAADPNTQGKRAALTTRDKCFNPDETYINTCGNCGLICWEKREDREENRRLLMNSGVVVLTAEGKRMAVPAEETTEVDTPYGVKVAMLRREARALPEITDLLKEGALATRIPRDTQILNYLALLPVAA
jgi:epoxyqueuosine reductase QueG